MTTVQQSPADCAGPGAADAPGALPGQPQRPITVTQRTIAGHPAVDVFTPYYIVPTPVVPIHNGSSQASPGGV